MFFPVIIFAYNRPMLLDKTLSSLEKCINYEKHDIFIFVDGPKDKSQLTMTRKVVEICEKYKLTNLKIQFRLSSKNKGLKDSIKSGISEILSDHNAVIVIEDDLIFSKDFLIYMNQGLEFYRDNRKIISICGYTPLNNVSRKATYSKRSSSWGWATWKDRWDEIDWDVEFAMSEYFQKPQLYFEALKLGYDFPILLDQYLKNEIDSWATVFTFNQLLTNKYSVHPPNTKVLNIGIWDSGTHFKNVRLYDKRHLDISKYIFDENIRNKNLYKFRLSNYKLMNRNLLRILLNELKYFYYFITTKLHHKAND